jgi:hypothetical protein
MSLKGTYYCSEINSTLIIDGVDNATGQANGTIEIDNIAIPIMMHYHLENNTGPVTDLWFAGNLDNPNKYVGGAGRVESTSYKSIKIAGGYPTENDVNTFEGTYKKQ